MTRRRAPLALVGPGAAGTALVAALSRAGWPVAGVVGRTEDSAARAASKLGLPPLGSSHAPAAGFSSAELVVVAVRDSDIPAVSALLAGRGDWSSRSALHLSGVQGPEALAPLAAAGASVAAFHPLMTFARAEDGRAPDWPADTPLFARGDRAAFEACEELADALGARCRTIPPGAGALYHAAATMGGNLMTVLLGLAEDVMRAAGIEDGAAALAPLARESLRGAALRGPAVALTGPVARGDTATLRRHVEALASAGLPPGLRGAHAVLSLGACELAGRSGRSGRPSVEELDAMRSLLREALRSLDDSGDEA